MEDKKHIFTYTNKDFVYDVCRMNENTTNVRSRFDVALKCGWAEKMKLGLFRYHLGDLETRVLAGNCGYIAQLNIQRGIERRKPQTILSIQQQFDSTLFNFNKIKSAEILFEMRKAEEILAEKDCARNQTSAMSFVIINSSPLEFGHCLLVPEPSRCHPQILIPSALQIGIESLFLSADPGYKVGFNSLGAFASVNHLHLHGYYLNPPLNIEWAHTELICPKNSLYRLMNFPKAFMFYADVQVEVRAVADTVCKLTDFLVKRNIAHNVFMTRGCPPDSEDKPLSLVRHGVRIFIWPRVSCFGAKEESGFNVALCELAGHLPLKNREDFEHLDEDGVKEIVQKYLLSDEEFSDLEKQLVKHL
ncbi:GDP-D-glucose phosphorylase 1 [Bagarius yarrelli]|uniref:GDP-D-glucose phosphorylase 1 n=1 Tax=Bagarius yarrelli TaxID=175774 RepID=A0A556TRE2_BAGYA|nr:GDP-D-glucose phosphorylase 1 [Bagarius yarrelli]